MYIILNKYYFQEDSQIEELFEDEVSGRTRVTNEDINAVLKRAKDRKLEEIKRYEMQQQLEATKLKKMDGENKDNKVNISYYL